jgi:signal transduction histidine kinase
MLERLDRAFSSQRRFLADTSHDLRTPLAVIRSNIEVVADDDNAKVEDWQEVGGIVRRNVEKMSEMIDGLLATARLQTGKAQAVALNLATLVESKAAELETLVSEQGILLETRTAPALVEGVEVSLDRAFTNLLDNAIRVSSPGSTIRVGVGVVEGWAWMAVADEGPGMPAEPSAGRFGLGLSIVEQIAEAHDGALVAHEGPDGLGTTMVIWLPTPGTKTRRPKLAPFTDA